MITLDRHSVFLWICVSIHLSSNINHLIGVSATAAQISIILFALWW